MTLTLDEAAALLGYRTKPISDQTCDLIGDLDRLDLELAFASACAALGVYAGTDADTEVRAAVEFVKGART